MLQINGLNFAYPGHGTLITNLDFQLGEGQISALIGSNGSGKTTLLELILGIHRPQQGHLDVLGFQPFRDRNKLARHVGYLPANDLLYSELSAAENLNTMAYLWGVPANEVKPLAEKALEQQGLWPNRNQLISQFSKGMRKRLAFAAACLHKPKLLILDEPFDGLDVDHVESMIHSLQAFVHEGGAILLVTHDFELIKLLATDISVLHQGKLVWSGKLADQEPDFDIKALFKAWVGEQDLESQIQ